MQGSMRRALLFFAVLPLSAGLITGPIGGGALLVGEEKSRPETGVREKGKTEGREKTPDEGRPSEDAIFGEEDTLTPSEKIKDDTVTQEIEKKSLTFSGFLNSRTSVNLKRSSILRDMAVVDNGNFLSYFQSNYELDARLIRGARGYVNASADYYPAGIPKSRVFQVPLAYLGIPAYAPGFDVAVSEKVNAVFSLNELFADVNIAKSVYFRFGKQVLKWGVGYLWTPTDLINVDKKNILDSSQVRQGAYGFKMHIPFGTTANIYSFVNFGKARHLIDIGSSNKVEVLFKNTEMALSVNLKNKNVPVYGYDFTSRLLGIDVHGEATVSYGDNTRKVRDYPWYLYPGYLTLAYTNLALFQEDISLMDYRVRGKWVPKASLGFGRAFEVLDVKDRIRIDFEGFYNSAGYYRNMFEKDYFTIGYFLSRGLYVPNYYGKYYAGAFVTISQMFVEELSAQVNCLVNVMDQSSVISGRLTYSPFYDLYLNLMVNGFIGKQNREYTVLGNYVTFEFSVKLVF